MSSTPRVLSVTFDIHFPAGLRANISEKRLIAAIDRLRGAVEALVPVVLPWADKVVMTTDWSYRWWRKETVLKMPKSPENTQ
jgi:hypothetical protein